MAIKEKSVVLDVEGKGNQDIISLMEEYFGCPATDIQEFESVDTTEQFAIVFQEAKE